MRQEKSFHHLVIKTEVPANPIQPTVAFHIETRDIVWFLYETKHWVEMG